VIEYLIDALDEWFPVKYIEDGHSYGI